MTNTMNYKEFKDYISDHIEAYLPEDFRCERVTVSQVCKSNDQILDALFIEEEGNIAAPNIYLEEYYTKYAQGTSTEDILKEIADFRICFRSPESIGLDPLICNPSALEKFENVKDKIVARLHNYEGSKTYLEDKAFRLVEDLAITYHIYVAAGPSIYTTAITRDLMRLYHTSIEELHSLAVKNMPQLMPIWFRSLDTLVAESIIDRGEAETLEETGVKLTEEGLIDDDGTMVISNSARCYGASVLLVPEYMDCLGRVLGKDLFIIPSSVHEVILRPAEQVDDVADLRRVIREVNRGVVEKEERLSDNVYTYDFEHHLPVICRDK